MTFKSYVSEFVDTHLRSNNVPKEVDVEMYRSIQNNLGNGKLLRVMPHADNDGMDAGEQLLQALHNLEFDWGIYNKSQEETFEIWFDDGKIQFFFYVEDSRAELKLRRQIRGFYPSAQIEEREELFTRVNKNDWVAGAEMNLKRSKYFPIRSQNGVRPFKDDPYKSITSDMVANNHCRTMVQVQFKPAHPEWAHGGPVRKHIPFIESTPFFSDVGSVSNSVKQDKMLSGFFNTETRDASSEERQLASKIMEQEGQPAYHVDLRILTFAPRRGEAKSNIWSVAKTFEQSFAEKGDQTLVQTPKNGKHLDTLVEEFAAREWVDRDIIMTVPEVSGLAHLPNGGVETPEIEWTTIDSSAGVPTDAERFYGSAVDQFDQQFTTDDSDAEKTQTSDASVGVSAPSSIYNRMKGIVHNIVWLGDDLHFVADDPGKPLPDTTDTTDEDGSDDDLDDFTEGEVDHDAEYEEVPDDGEVADDEFVAESNVVTDDTDDDSEPSTDEGLDEDTDADESPGEGLPGEDGDSMSAAEIGAEITGDSKPDTPGESSESVDEGSGSIDAEEEPVTEDSLTESEASDVGEDAVTDEEDITSHPDIADVTPDNTDKDDLMSLDQPNPPEFVDENRESETDEDENTVADKATDESLQIEDSHGEITGDESVDVTEEVSTERTETGSLEEINAEDGLETEEEELGGDSEGGTDTVEEPPSDEGKEEGKEGENYDNDGPEFGMFGDRSE